MAIILTKIGTIEVESSPRQTHTFPSRVTENPVEDGTVFADNIVLLPVVLDLECRLSDSSITTGGFLFNLGRASAIERFKQLVNLQATREPFTVVTGLNVYSNMVLEELSVPRQAGDGKSVRFFAVLKEVLIIGRDVPTNRDLVALDVRHTALPVRSLGFVNRVEIPT